MRCFGHLGAGLPGEFGVAGFWCVDLVAVDWLVISGFVDWCGMVVVGCGYMVVFRAFACRFVFWLKWCCCM